MAISAWSQPPRCWGREACPLDSSPGRAGGVGSSWVRHTWFFFLAQYLPESSSTPSITPVYPAGQAEARRPQGDGRPPLGC